MRVRGPLLVAAAAAVVLVPAAISAAATELVGTVGPGFTILLERDGRAVSQLDPGPYTIAVSDLSEEHNFHLFGPGVNEATQVETTGKVTWTVNLVEGRYTLVCDPHATSMRQEFVVGNPPPLPQPGPSPVPTVPKLLATVGPKNTISLRNAAGTLLKTVKSGTYSIVVRDRSKAHNFHLVGKGVNRKTVVATTATVTWRLRLQAGVLRFYSDRAPKTVKGSVTVR